MPQRRAFLLRIDPAVLEAMQHWADDDLRSLNAQIEFVLRRCLVDRGRVKEAEPTTSSEADVNSHGQIDKDVGQRDLEAG